MTFDDWWEEKISECEQLPSEEEKSFARYAWNAAMEVAAQKCDMYVEAYSFAAPYPKGYEYTNEEFRAGMIFAQGRFKVAAETIRGYKEGA